ncbi:MAG TPA: ABC transporter ATP-binding protein [Novosphingobium sp.]|nr:ABC transporter ATP-binding protein [Novosphingobium sp.]HZV10491.1 ABC transporter ATP-binding protein [Novosphingobium sp.]
MSALLELSGLSRSFGALKVTDDVSLAIPEGQAVGIIGPNGAGKSTLFSLITGTLMPDAGQVGFVGQDVSRRPAAWRSRHGIARSFQVPQPFAGMTVFENLLTAASFGGGLAGRAAAQRAHAVLAQTHLAHRADTLAGDLTLLDRKRVELARALATNPRLLLLDEIAGGLTDAECAQLIDIVRDIHAGGVTIVWIEHIVHALMAVVSRLVVLDTGRVVADGPPQAVISSPAVVALYTGMAHD